MLDEVVANDGGCWVGLDCVRMRWYQGWFNTGFMSGAWADGCDSTMRYVKVLAVF